MELIKYEDIVAPNIAAIKEGDEITIKGCLAKVLSVGANFKESSEIYLTFELVGLKSLIEVDAWDNDWHPDN